MLFWICRFVNKGFDGGCCGVFIGKFRYLFVVEDGEVIVLLDIIKCFYDVIVCVEGVVEKGNVIVVVIEFVECEWSVKGFGVYRICYFVLKVIWYEYLIWVLFLSFYIVELYVFYKFMCILRLDGYIDVLIV